MKMAGFDFEIKSKHVDENHPTNVNSRKVPIHLAEKKAVAFLAEISDQEIVIGADTMVFVDGRIFEKPLNREDAISMLSTLSGKIHEVVTGVCILSRDKKVVFDETTKVFFNELDRSEIEYYVDKFQPFDKAGSYACQEWIGAIGIRRFEGDYFNVVGLPVNRVYQELKKF